MTSLEVENSIFSSALRSIPPAPSAITSVMIWLNWGKCTGVMIDGKELVDPGELLEMEMEILAGLGKPRICNAPEPLPCALR